MDVIEAMRTTGTRRYYRDEPMPEDVLYAAFDAARLAPQGGNRQPVRWIAVRDRALKAALKVTDAGLGRTSVVGGASIYPTMQNLCLALRAAGVAPAVTTMLCREEPAVRALLGIPDEYFTAAYVCAGYPARPFPTKLRRRPVEEFVYADRFGEPLYE
ncbi:nitroreductase family protein [Tomitella cavernea]|uniref:Nitroreductase domain-containing protein n=1 Tax=Tomitella cavernea TaxID=1387982 RepID=A0ABP9C0L3_9ACTN|nr:nitroreductase family protein [Tomitella cavernea]